MIKVEKGIPAPVFARGEIAKVLEAMEVGESFALPLDQIKRGSLSTLACSIGKAKGKAFVTRSKDNMIRVWRVK